MYRSRRLIASATFALLTAVLPSPAAANLIMNGSFETSGLGRCSEQVLQPGSMLLDGWVVTRGSIDYIGGGWPGLDGACSIDLDGTPGFGGVAQTFSTTPDHDYRVNFSMAGNPLHYSPTEPKLKLMRMSAADTFGDFSFLTDVNDNSWEAYEWIFTAVDTQTMLEFYSLDTAEAGYSGFFGPALDNVVVSAVPEPATGALLIMGIALLATRRTEPRISEVARSNQGRCPTRIKPPSVKGQGSGERCVE